MPPPGIDVGLSSVVVTSQSRQPFWDPGGFKPSIDSGSDPNWEAPVSAWSQWDTAEIGTMDGRLRVPGLVRVTSRQKHRNQLKKPPGASGARGTLLGFEPAEVDMQVSMWTTAQLAQWELLVGSIIRQLRTSLLGPAIPGDDASPRKQAAFDVFHPGLALHGIRALYFDTFVLPHPTNTPQVFEASIRWVEFSPIDQKGAPVTVLGARGEVQASGKFGLEQKPKLPSESGGAEP